MLATTLTIVAVFMPVAFVTGIVGQFFRQFGITISAAVLMSLFVAFTLDPMLSARFSKAHRARREGTLRRAQAPVRRVLRGHRDMYRGMLALGGAATSWSSACSRSALFFMGFHRQADGQRVRERRGPRPVRRRGRAARRHVARRNRVALGRRKRSCSARTADQAGVRHHRRDGEANKVEVARRHDAQAQRTRQPLATIKDVARQGRRSVPDARSRHRPGVRRGRRRPKRRS